MKWWRESRFGMFIHFGIYAVAEGMWKGEPVEGLAEWMQFRRRIPVCEYEKLAEGLTLRNFDAKAIVDLAKAAGMKYIVYTAKHHDGFAMYDSKYSDYNVVKMCPSHRDPARELAEEAHKAGLKMCFYYSQVLDWQDPDAFGNDWDYDPSKKVFRRFLDGKCKSQLRELLTGYGDIGLIWFDMPKGIAYEESLELKAFVKELQPDCLVSGRIYTEPTVGDYGSMGDNEFPSGKLPGDWETPATLNNTWGYRKLDTNWKEPAEIIRLLVELLGKGMNYLLNIGPMADGSVPEESSAILKEVGKWVEQNGEAVYGTLATPYSCDFEWGRISEKENRLYLYLFEKNKAIRVPGIHNKVQKVRLLKKGRDIPIEFTKRRDEEIVSFELPDTDTPYFDVVCLELDGSPDVEQGIFEQPDGRIHLYAHMAKLNHTGGESDGITIDPNGNIVNWFRTEDRAEWEFAVRQPGMYSVLLQTRGVKYTPWAGGHRVAAECCGQRMEAVLSDGKKVSNAHSRYFDERLSDLGTIRIPKAGTRSLTLKLLNCNPEEKAGLLVTRILLERVTV